MQVRNPDDDPTLFAREPPLSLWRVWFAFALFFPIFGTLLIGLPTVTALAVLWAIGGRDYVASVWSGPPSGPPPYRLPVLPTVGLITVASLGGAIGYIIWQALFFNSGFIDKPAFEHYFDLTKPKRLFQALLVLILVGLAWLAVVIPLILSF